MGGNDVYLSKLSEELRLRKYSRQTEKSYSLIIRNFIKSELRPRDFLLKYTEKSRSSIRSVYFALKFFHETVLRQKFDETIPLAKNKIKLPSVLSKEEIGKIFETTMNIKHRLVLMFLYYAGIRLNEVILLPPENAGLKSLVLPIGNDEPGVALLQRFPQSGIEAIEPMGPAPDIDHQGACLPLRL